MKETEMREKETGEGTKDCDMRREIERQRGEAKKRGKHRKKENIDNYKILFGKNN